jgi:hypothetical protein
MAAFMTTETCTPDHELATRSLSSGKLKFWGSYNSHECGGFALHCLTFFVLKLRSAANHPSSPKIDQSFLPHLGKRGKQTAALASLAFVFCPTGINTSIHHALLMHFWCVCSRRRSLIYAMFINHSIFWCYIPTWSPPLTLERIPLITDHILCIYNRTWKRYHRIMGRTESKRKPPSSKRQDSDLKNKSRLRWDEYKQQDPEEYTPRVQASYSGKLELRDSTDTLWLTC